MKLLLLCLLLVPAGAYASPPKSVTATYDAASGSLTVAIKHGSPFPSWHYINKVRIKKNGAELEVHKYKSQPTKSEFTYVYQVALAAGDSLEITASCNLFGSKTAVLTLAKP